MASKKLSVKEEWDALSTSFKINRTVEIDPNFADNVVIAWPEILQIIEKQKQSKQLRILDYGCGTGGLCERLAMDGHIVTGVDISKRMIAIAQDSSPHSIEYIVGDHTSPKLSDHSFDVVTSIMVFQFVEDIESLLFGISKYLKSGSMVVFATVNPDFVKKCEDEGLQFSFKENSETSQIYAMDLIGTTASFSLYVRSEEQYRKLFGKQGFSNLTTSYPPFTQEFLEKYPWKLISDVPEFLIMGFVKK